MALIPAMQILKPQLRLPFLAIMEHRAGQGGRSAGAEDVEDYRLILTLGMGNKGSEMSKELTEEEAFARLAELGCDDVVTGIGRTGVIGGGTGQRQDDWSAR